MRICYLSNSMIPSRTANSVHVMKMCQAYAQLGHDVTLVVPDRPQRCESGVADFHAFYDVQPVFDISHVRPRRPGKLWYAGGMTRHALAVARPEFIHTRNEWVGWGAGYLARRPFVLELHESPTHSYVKTKAVRHAVRGKYSRGVIAITHALAKHFSEAIASDVNVMVEPDAVDQAWLDRAFDQTAIRNDLGLGQETRTVITYVGSLHAGRGIELIIRLAERLSNCCFLIVGGNDDQIERLRGQTNGLNNLRLLGFAPQKRVPEYLAAADILLMPYQDGVKSSSGKDTSAYLSPMKMFEYMSAGRPIVSSTLPVLEEILEHETNALCIAADCVDSWQSSIQKLIAEPGYAQALGNRARLDVQRYTWQERAKRILGQAI
ncbi:Putative teichuronic acid biosynthesis glycosyltransferase TuaH [Stieleria neptunia]|uniref:Teichuronic acid biosynthesis glycosyltransferase TuaH n=1 Tax=Stieleria neptunia TaxID=2527979 RepID=A0A518HN72_9BACT|nr:glycosyltransferase family 4 protein [Stieleria neptunia]QDV42304.1 Putative teichuronic acid biosynthesis glycosyltransferase TuaH [Stieleria neptunia]